MFGFKKDKVNPYQEAYVILPNSGLIPDRKSVLAVINGQECLIYPKAMVKEVKINDTSIVAGYTVIDTILTRGFDGLVIAVKA